MKKLAAALVFSFTVLTLILFFVGCATSTPYEPLGSMGGYEDMKIQEGVYKVTFRGNGYTSESRASSFALLRAAELALENGYSFFIALNEKESMKHSSYTTPVTAHTSGIAALPPPLPTPYGLPAPAPYFGTTTYTGGETYDIDKPRYELVIQCFHGRPINYSGIVYDARQVWRNIRQQYSLRQNG